MLYQSKLNLKSYVIASIPYRVIISRTHLIESRTCPFYITRLRKKSKDKCESNRRRAIRCEISERTKGLYRRRASGFLHKNRARRAEWPCVEREKKKK